MDLYRLESPEECLRLGLSDALKTDVALVEWPEALGPAHTPVTHLAVDLRQTQVGHPSRAEDGACISQLRGLTCRQLSFVNAGCQAQRPALGL